MTDERPPYLRELLSSKVNLCALLGSLAAGGALAATLGPGIGAIPLIAFAAGEIIAAMFVSDARFFRARIDRKYRAKSRDALRDQLLDEIRERCTKPSEAQQLTKTYLRMADRICTMRSLRKRTHTHLTLDDLERLEDVSVDFLSMFLARLLIEDRADSIDPSEVHAQIADLTAELESSELEAGVGELMVARDEYAGILARRRVMMKRRRALEAAMLAIPDQMEEIFQMVITNPDADDLGARLEHALGRLPRPEEIEAKLSPTLSGSTNTLLSPMPAPNAKKHVQHLVE